MAHEEERGLRLARERPQELEAGLGVLAVEVARRLVGEHEVGLARERARDRDALLLPDRELAGRWPRRCERPTRSSAARAASFGFATPGRNDMPTSTFSSAVIVESRLNVWNT